MIHFSDFIRFLLENVNDWTRCQLSKTLWPCKGRFVIQVFIFFALSVLALTLKLSDTSAMGGT